MVKRYGNLWERVVSIENITQAYHESRKGKTSKPGVRQVDEDPSTFIMEIQRLLVNKEYRSGEYREFQIHERGKDRLVYDVDYFPHRIVHWALMLVIRPILMDSIGDHSYAAMQGRGSHQALTKLKGYLHKDPEGTKYCFKMDVRKFFPSIDKDLMMKKLARKIKDPDVLWLCSEIIYGYPGPGLPIGNYTSQYFANYYLANIDRHMKQVMHCKHYLRYMDDIIVLGKSKSWLRRVKKRMDQLLTENGLTMKSNWQIFPVESRGVDFVGYRTFHNFCLVRTKNKNKMKRAMRRLEAKLDAGHDLDEHDLGCLASWSGILGWCDSWRLAKKTTRRVKRKQEARNWMKSPQHRTHVPSSS